MNRKKLIHVTASLDQGGAETVLFNLVRGLLPFYDQQVISFRNGPFNQRIAALGVPVIVLPAGFLRFSVLYRMVCVQRPDVIHSLLWSSNAIMRFYARVFKIPLICAIHSPFNTGTGNSWLRSIIDQFTANWATYTVFVSQNVFEQATVTPYVTSDRRVVISNGIDLNELGAMARTHGLTRVDLGLDGSDFVLGTVGRLVPVKNQIILIKLVERLRDNYPNFRLIIVGHGPLQGEFALIIHEKGLAGHVLLVQGTGAVYYPLFDCFVLPSKTEGLSMALLEAMSFKLPVFVARTAGVQGVISPGVNGLVFNPENLDELTVLVEQVIHDRALCQRLGAQAYKTVNNSFTVGAMVASYRQLFDKILRK